MIPSTGRLSAGDTVLFIDQKEREYLRILKEGARIHIRGGAMQADHLIGLAEGHTVYNSAREPFLMLRPTFAQLIPHLPRQAQVIYPKDIGPILLWGDIYPGATVIEVGVGPGAMSMALLRAIGTEGRLVTYEMRPDFIEMACANVRDFLGATPNWTIKLADAFEGLAERNADRILVDLSEPWRMLPAAASALRPGGVFIGYVPTVLQVKNLVDGLREHGAFGAVQSFETLQRFWHVKRLSIRPEHRMVAHTGFVVVGRRLANSDCR